MGLISSLIGIWILHGILACLIVNSQSKGKSKVSRFIYNTLYFLSGTIGLTVVGLKRIFKKSV